MKSIINNLSRFKKSLVFITLDSILAYFSISVALLVQSSILFDLNFKELVSIGVLAFVVVIISSKIFKIDKIVLRGFSLSEVSLLLFYSLLIAILIFVTVFLLTNNLFNIGLFSTTLQANSSYELLSIIFIFSITFFISILFLRLFLLFLLSKINLRNKNNRKKVAIFGAGNAGVQLMRSFDNDLLTEFLCFVDDNPNLRNTVISGIRVFSRKDFESFLNRNKLDEIWIAIPTLTVEKLQQIIDYLSKYSKKILSLPEINNLRFNSDFRNRLSRANINNFLGRETVEIEKNIYLESYANKNILITGAGGSIGSELSLQVLKSKPKLVILFELNELALYNLEKKIYSLKNIETIKIITCLGTINDEKRIQNIINKYNVQVILHAAAYKHVNLVESNIIEGFRNNVLGTNNLVNCALKAEVERFVLVSSDKAVRPTNIMGATKRLSEIIVQNRSKDISKINFSIVRFGNVIGSSGSVIPLFMSQINSGGPVTVTDAEMTRYFMAIPEAAQLILVAGSFGKKGEIYLLDMGEPIKILDLAKNMIFLSGNKIKNKNDKNDGIEIEIINKRPGEKIREELLIDGKIQPTNHKKVMVLDETRNIDFPLEQALNDIEKAIVNQDENIIKVLLNDHLKDYKPTNN